MLMPEWIELLSIEAQAMNYPWLQPALEVMHFSGHTLSVGTIIYLDLRLLGMNKGLPVMKLSSHVIPWTILGLVLAIVSGSALFLANPGYFWGNPALEVKLVLIAVALLNVAIFHYGIFRSVDNWDINIGTPITARLGGLISILFWLAVIVCGRLIAYF